MEKIERDSIILNIISRLNEKNSWCGETHIQKSMYLLQEIAQIDCGFQFILYKHGPFSFDLRDEISYLKSLGTIDYYYKNESYGPSIKLTDYHRTSFIMSKTNSTNSKLIQKIINFIGDKNVKDLEILSTIQLLLDEHKNNSVLINELRSIKPHISQEDAEKGLTELKEFKLKFNVN